MDDLTHLDRINIWHPFTALIGVSEPVLITSASGVYLHTKDGKKIIDAISSWWVNIHGHSHPYIAKALFEQANKLEHVIFAGFTHEPAIRLSENLLRILPANQSKLFFSDNGSTAVEVALKLSLQYWNNQQVSKQRIIAINGAYHGDTFGGMSVGERSLFTKPFTEHLFDTTFIDFPEGHNNAKIIDDFKNEIGKGNVAAFIFEPLVQGASGMRMYTPDVLDELIHHAQQHDVICIADEVFTGFGRTGKMFASDFLTHKPDIMAISKGITGGTLPLGVTSCNEKIVSAFKSDQLEKTFFHGHSYTANPLACTAANASYELLMSPECQQQINMIESSHKNFISAFDQRLVKNIRSIGTILAIELHAEGATTYSNPLRKKIYPYFLERGILLRPLGNVIYVVPPYVITAGELNSIYQCILEFITEN